MLSVGVDGAEGFHLVALGTPDQGIIEVLRSEPQPQAVAQLPAHIAALEPDPTEVRGASRPATGGWWRRSWTPAWPGRKKGVAEDARIAGLVGLDRFVELKQLIPHGELASELRAIARDDERATQDQRRLLNRLRMDLLSPFGAALEIAGDGLGRPPGCACGSAGRPMRGWPLPLERSW
jgi:hypothetical protein